MDDNRNGNDLEEKAKQSSPEASFEQMISYNMSEAERPGGLKVRFKEGYSEASIS
jgi:hypothetical protein